MKTQKTQSFWTGSDPEITTKEINRAINIMVGALIIGGFLLAGSAGCIVYLLCNN